MLTGAVRPWGDPNVWWWAKVWNAVVLLACLGYLWFAIYWKVLDFNSHY